ncbi:MAG TPA: hypothetical protein VK986_03805, partial [Tepidisphaeraceae bacterium]|nr:hypothetical protein [Tepidisphaeraceae bacterium]
MSPRTRSTLAMIVTLGAVGVVGGILVMRVNAGGKAAPPKTPEPATVTRAVKESDLNVVTLAPEAVARLGLVTA